MSDSSPLPNAADIFDRSWQRAWRGLGVAVPAAGLQARLLACYAEPQRHYHSLQHLRECLEALETSLHLAQQPAEVELALWFHDAVYALQRSDNEQKSADWARDALLAAALPPVLCQRVHDLVMATRHSAAPEATDEQLLVDIDLGILAAPATRFAEYERQIRAEYAFVPGWIFRRKRRAVLQSFLDRSHIYSTPHFFALHEAAARINLEAAVA